jgi:hypothetical protein
MCLMLALKKIIAKAEGSQNNQFLNLALFTSLLNACSDQIVLEFETLHRNRSVRSINLGNFDFKLKQ